jgi:alpha-N-arabinofuranosidase
MMLGTDFERHFIARLRKRLPDRVRLPLSEFGTIWGDARVFPSWPASMSHALYMATQWVNWSELGVPWATGGALTTANRRGVLGPPPKFVFSASAAARQVVVPMFEEGGRRITVHLRHDPVRVTGINAARVVDIRTASYPGLKVLATRGSNRDLYLLVINRLPQAKGAVKVRIELDGYTSRGKALVRSVSGKSFKSWNGPHHGPTVKMRTGKTRTARHHLNYRFPAHSITVLHIPRAR